MIGRNIAHYRITAKLGEGGMGEVWRATDTKLNRDVALKVLPESFAQDPERMARFQREAHVLASLNHPNIAAIYGLEDRALVMELVEGQALAGPLPVDTALRYARQMIDALEAAHEKGITHRDLKPANIMVTAEGQVKVLDFGLAKAAETTAAPSENSPTLTLAATRMGVIMGTAGYMAPEQARGQVVDRRADIWAFGVVLYEILTGKRMFSGGNVSDILASVLKSDPDWSLLPAETPREIRRLLAHCLVRDVKKRLQAIGDARIFLEEDAASPAARKTRSWPVMAVCAALAVAATVGVTQLWREAPAAQPVWKLDIPLAGLKTGIESPPALSPDGRKIVYVASGGLWVRELDHLEPRQLAAAVFPEYPFWSPDSQMIGYLADGKLWKVATGGGAPQLIASAGFNRGANTPGAVWTPEGRIIFAPAASGSGLIAVAAQGGDFAAFVNPDLKTESDFHKPSLLPDGKGLLYVLDRNEGGPDTIGVLSGQTRKTLLQLKGELLDSPVYSPTGHILYRRETTTPGIWALPFSLEKLEAQGDPFLVTPNGVWPSVSLDGTLVYTAESNSGLRLAWIDRSGKAAEIPAEPQIRLRDPRISPDGGRIAAYWGNALYVFDTGRNSRTRLTFDTLRNFQPAWTPAGDRLYYGVGQGTANPYLASQAAAGGGKAENLGPGLMPDVSRDGKWLVFADIIAGQGFELFYMRLDGDRKRIPLLAQAGNQSTPALSPDSSLLAYVSTESGKGEIYIKPFPQGDGKWQVSFHGGRLPRWNRAGNALFFVQGNSLMEVSLTRAPAVALGTPREVVRGDAAGARLDMNYDVSPDGTRFLVVKQAEEERNTLRTVTVVRNWFGEFAGREKR